MTSPLLLAQQVFSTFTRNRDGVNPPFCMTNTSLPPTNAAIPAPHPHLPDALPMDFASLINVLVSFSALREWVKIIFLGTLLDLFRRLVVHLCHKFYQSFFITGTFLVDDDEAYSWIDSWLKQQKPWKLAHDMHIWADPSSNETDISLAFDDEPMDPTRRSKVRTWPKATSGISLWYKRHWVRALHIFETNSHGVKSLEMLRITILAWNRGFLDRLMLDAEKAHEHSADQTVYVYVSKFKCGEYRWGYIASRAKRPLQSIVLDPGVRDMLLEDAKDFLASQRWYDCRGIPFRRGYLLYGAPGSGKSSIIHSIAGELGLNIYVISLSGIGLDDDGLRALMISGSLPSRCIFLMEDIDVALSNTLNREPENKKGDPSTSTTTSAHVSAPPPLPRNRVTLSGLLNALDGIAAYDGRIFFATTNRYEALDPALCRPGRMDVHVEFKLASRYQAAELFKYFYTPEDQAKTDGHSNDDQKGITDEDPSHLLEGVEVGGTLHRHQLPALSSSELSALAEQFSEAIPDREFSMASLQGYLMRYKTDPHGAAIGVAAWVAKETEAREK